MRDRYLIVVATIAASAITACSDAAVDQVTAPSSAATPVQPVANTWPTEEEYEENEIPSAIGLQIGVNPYFSADTLSFVVEARVTFQWANDVSAHIWASVINKNGSVINSSEAGMAYQRLALPVLSGDTTFVVRVSTNGIKCGLTGKSTYEGRASAKAIDSRIVVITLWQQDILKTSGPDVQQAACPEEPATCPVTRLIGGGATALPSTDGCDDDEAAPAPPNGSLDPVEVCYFVWRELWILDFITGRFSLVYSYLIGYFCYLLEE